MILKSVTILNTFFVVNIFCVKNNFGLNFCYHMLFTCTLRSLDDPHCHPAVLCIVSAKITLCNKHVR